MAAIPKKNLETIWKFLDVDTFEHRCQVQLFITKNRANNLQREKTVQEKLLSTSSLISPSFQGGPTIFHEGNFLKHTPFSKNL